MEACRDTLKEFEHRSPSELPAIASLGVFVQALAMFPELASIRTASSGFGSGFLVESSILPIYPVPVALFLIRLLFGFD